MGFEFFKKKGVKEATMAAAAMATFGAGVETGRQVPSAPTEATSSEIAQGDAPSLIEHKLPTPDIKAINGVRVNANVGDPDFNVGHNVMEVHPTGGVKYIELDSEDDGNHTRIYDEDGKTVLSDGVSKLGDHSGLPLNYKDAK